MAGAILITGASSGIGLDAAVYLARHGQRVVGTMRDLGKRGALDTAARQAGVSVDVVSMDVTDDASIGRAVAEVTFKYGAIDALVNNAGVLLRGYFEDLSDAEIRRVFDTNVFGTMAVTRAVIAGMREAKRGRIVFLSSVAGLIGSVGVSAYSASKFAMEGFAGSLALEMALYGVDVSLIEPGNINTPIWKTGGGIAERAMDDRSPNHEYFERSERLAEWAVSTSPIRTEHVAKAIHHAVTAKRPKRRYLVGYRPAGFFLARRILPGELFERIYTKAVLGKLRTRQPARP